MEDNKKLTDEQVKEVQTIVNKMLEPDAGDQKITELNAMSTILDNDLFAMVDVAGDETKKATALQYKNYIGKGQESFDKTVGAAGSGADYNDIQNAVADGFYNLLIIGDFLQPNTVTSNANLLTLTIAKRLRITDKNFAIGSGGVKVRKGIIQPTLTGGGSRLFTSAGVTTLDLADTNLIMTGVTGVNAGIAAMATNSKHLIHNCKITLSNTAFCGFIEPGASSSFTNLNVVGGGSSCEGFIRSGNDCIIDNINISGTFKTASTFISSAIGTTTPPIISNVLSSSTSEIAISLTTDLIQVSNIYGKINLTLTGSSSTHVVNCVFYKLLFASGTNNNNFFINCRVTGATAISITADSNTFVNCNFNPAVTLTGASDNNQFLLCNSTGGFTDSGTNNIFLTGITGNFANSGYSTFGGLPGGDYPSLKFKHYTGTMPTGGANLVVTAATLGLTDARQIVISELQAQGSDNNWWKSGNTFATTHAFSYSIPRGADPNAGDLAIQSPVAATTVHGQPFEFKYWYQATNFLGSEASKTATSSIACTT